MTAHRSRPVRNAALVAAVVLDTHGLVTIAVTVRLDSIAPPLDPPAE